MPMVRKRKKKPEWDVMEKSLSKMADMLRKARPDVPIASLYEFAVRYGKGYRFQPLPDQYDKMTPQRCYANCMELMLRNLNLIYVEGYAGVRNLPVPLNHAWCVEKGTNLVIDPTTSGCRYYFGVAFDRKYVIKQVANEKRRCASLIDNLEDGFPLLKMSDEQIRKIIAKD